MATVAEMVFRLHKTIAAVAPIVSVSVVDEKANPPTTNIEFDPSATQKQMDDADNIVAAFDWSESADVAFKDAQDPDQAEIKRLVYTPDDKWTPDDVVKAAQIAMRRLLK